MSVLEPEDGRRVMCEECKEWTDDILRHLSINHPDVWAEGFERWPDGEIVVIDDTITPEDFNEK